MTSLRNWIGYLWMSPGDWAYCLRRPISTARAMWSLHRDPPGAVFLLPLPPDDLFDEEDA